MPFAGEGNLATGGTSPLTPSMGLGAPFRDWGQLGAAAVGQGAPAPWWGAGVSGTARVTHIAAGLPKGCISDRWVTGQFCRHIDQETLVCPGTALWCGLLCACPWKKDELFLRVLLDLDPYLVTLSGNLAHFIHAVSCKVLEKKVFYGLRCSQIILILFLYLMANFS